MKMHDERYVLSIAASHKAVRLRDHQTGEIHEWTGTRALYDALGVLADWRERDTNAGEDRCECIAPSGWTVANIDGSTARRHSPLCPLAAPRNPDYVRDYAVPEIKCPACGVTGGMPHDCETAGRIS